MGDAQGEEKIKRVTEKGSAVGIREEERQAKYGRNYYALIHTRESQQMILEMGEEAYLFDYLTLSGQKVRHRARLTLFRHTCRCR